MEKKDQKKINKNKKKWEEQKKAGKSTGSSGSIEGSYERKKWGANEDTGNGLKQFDSVWHMLCNKGCGWNKTHTTGWHKRFLANPLAYPSALPATHPYSQLTQQQLPPSNTSPTPVPSSSSTQGSSMSSITFGANEMVIDKTKWKSVLEEHEGNSQSADVAALCGLLEELLN